MNRILTFPMRTVCITAFFFALPLLAHAENYSVSPLIIDEELEKRDIVEKTITITNNDSKMIRLYATVNEITLGEGGSIQEFLPPSMVDRTTSVTSWLEISRARIELQPGESKDLTLTIRVNPEVAPGEYHAFVGFGEGSNRNDAEKKVMAGTAPGTVVRIGVDKVQNQFLRLEKFSVERFIKKAGEGFATFMLMNPGEDSVVPKGEIIFYDNRGNEVASTLLNEEGTVVEPGKEASFTQKVPEDLPMGKYKAFLSVEYGEHQMASLNDTAFFYVLPLQWLLAIFFGFLICAIALALFVHRKLDLADARADDGADDVAMYIRSGRSESKDHDIDLTKKNTDA